MYAANNEGIDIIGGILLRLSGHNVHNNSKVEAAEMVYVTNSTELFYLSRHAMEQFRIIGPNFPSVGGSTHFVCAGNVSSEVKLSKCGCPKHQNALSRPSELPFPPTEENIPHMKEWLLAQYASSTFNQCPHQAMPFLRDDPSMKVYIDPMPLLMQYIHQLLFPSIGVNKLK